MSPKDMPPQILTLFLDALRDSAYQGDISDEYADRLINATDNSIYQIMPQAILFPKTRKDLDHIVRLGTEDRFKAVQFMPRGGGTGTNGQSLNSCIIIDTSKYLTQIIELNVSENWVRVEPGIVLDQLNAELSKHNLFFPVHISPSKSCTIGGMVATDACGKGSRVYGKTSDYCLSLTCLFSDGREIQSHNHTNDDIEHILSTRYNDILKTAPKLPRGLSAYDLIGARINGRLNMTRLIAGSEGSLAIIKDIKLKLIPKPPPTKMVAVFYNDFDCALRDAQTTIQFDPIAIETIDDVVLELAQNDILWHRFQTILPDDVDPGSIRGAHFVEFQNNIPATYLDHLKNNPAVLGVQTTEDPALVKNISNMRSKAVGLLGNMKGDRRPVAFMEDTAVPPEHLADYIASLKTLLKKHNLRCGMFGHVDAGCLHVRPALDLRQTKDRAMIRTLTDDVVALVKKHGGVLWGEHGKGLRSEYTQQLAGTPYFEAMQAIKHILDPQNKLNPGKIAGPDLIKIDEAPMRGQFDAQIDTQINVKTNEQDKTPFAKATQCNGNGLCFSAMPDDAMCPSYKITKDRKHSPKGRAALLREWMRLKDIKSDKARSFSNDVYQALHGCLSCKACTSTCPIHVNIPDMKANFLHEYHRKEKRELRHYLIAFAEIYSRFACFVPFMPLHIHGLKDLPKPQGKSLSNLMRDHGFSYAAPGVVEQTDNSVLVLQDAYTSYYEPNLVLANLQLLEKLGYKPLVLPFRQSGKSWHVKGFLKQFEKIALSNISWLENWSEYNVPIIGIDPSLTLIYRDEYHHLLHRKPKYTVLLLQEFLKAHIDKTKLPKITTIPKSNYPLFLHCTENTMMPGSAEDWATIFKSFEIKVNPQITGCCGMAGAYGHEEEHVDYSKGLYDLSWKDKMTETAIVTGYSCRSQIKRMEDYKTKHPVELLNDLL